MRGVAPRLLRLYLGLLGAGLLLQGLVSLALGLAGVAPPDVTLDFLRADPLHAAIHIAWGLAMAAAVARGSDDARLVRLGLAFGAFYVALAALGLLVHHPLGLRLDPGENGFHAIVGPLALALAGWAALAGRAPAGAATP